MGASGRDVLAVQSALAQLGKPYVWAGSGQDSFDCSGLTMWAWATAGVSLPHLAAAQQSMGAAVGRSQLRLAELVFFGAPAANPTHTDQPETSSCDATQPTTPNTAEQASDRASAGFLLWSAAHPDRC